MCDPGPYSYTNCQDIKCGLRRTGSDCIKSNRIMGGQDAQCNEWPWQAYIYATIDQNKGIACGGSLVNQRFVVTSSHCIHEFVNKTELVTVWLGRHTRYTSSGKKAFDIDEIIIHEKYDNISQENDIAVIKLSEMVDMETYTPICMPRLGLASSQDLHQENLTTTGWGRINYDGDTTLNLQELVETIPIVTKQQCLETPGNYSINAGIYAGWPYIVEIDLKKGMVCAGIPNNHQANCKGDSGGPLIHMFEHNRYELVGTTSWSPKDWDSQGNREACTRSYNIYTDVPYYRSWIIGQVGYVYFG